ncbi:MAG: hypothetical protein AB8B53_02905 [Flavobacteriales bacterium]
MNTQFAYNPFSGVLDDDINDVLVPQFNVDDLLSMIKRSESLALEFQGKQGRGKTSHLKFLHKYLSEFPIVFLDSSSAFSEIRSLSQRVVFVDSIHHLSVLNRRKLFKQNKIVIYTTHRKRNLECFFAKKKHVSIGFNGINEEVLTCILNKRLEFAALTKVDSDDLFHSKEVNDLIGKYGDDYRGIINHLFDRFQ